MGRDVKFIRDPIHGSIMLDKLQLELLNSPELQRLSHIKQLDLTYLVYPGATHSRILHAVGVSYLASTIASYMGFSEDERNILKAAAMLHDIGHPPFSHALTRFQEKEHEERGADLITGKISFTIDGSGEIPSMLERHGIEAKEVAELVRKKHPNQNLQHIIAADIDADRLDYLPRDAYFTGVHFGAVDVERLMTTFVIADGQFCIMEKAVDSVESMLIARNHMYTNVYAHHTVRIAAEMLQRAFTRVKDRHPNWEEYNDMELMLALKEGDSFAKEIYDRIVLRRLFKTAYLLSEIDLNDEKREKIKNIASDPRAFEEEIAKKSGIKSDYVMLDSHFQSIKKKTQEETKVKVLRKNGEIVNLSEMSELIKSLLNKRMVAPAFAVYTLDKYLPKVRQEVKKAIED